MYPIIPPLLAVFVWSLGGAALVVLAMSDLRCRLVPNGWVALLAADGLTLRLGARVEWGAPLLSIVTGLGVLLVLGQFARHGLSGGGDAKLIAAVTLAVPPIQVPALLLAIMLAGGLIAGIYACARCMARHDGVLLDAGRGAFHQFLQRERRRTVCAVPMPYAVAVAAGTLGFLVHGLIP
ncbi:MAG: A24 family peptidase [Acetobacteraceae bacterium]